MTGFQKFLGAVLALGLLTLIVVNNVHKTISKGESQHRLPVEVVADDPCAENEQAWSSDKYPVVGMFPACFRATGHDAQVAFLSDLACDKGTVKETKSGTFVLKCSGGTTYSATPRVVTVRKTRKFKHLPIQDVRVDNQQWEWR
jgi:hypothetical protein